MEDVIELKVKLTRLAPGVEGRDTLLKDTLLAETLLLVNATGAFMPWVMYMVPFDTLKTVGVVLARVVFIESEFADIPVEGELMLVAFRKFWVITRMTCTPWSFTSAAA